MSQGAGFRWSVVKITRAICDQPYGNRDFDVEDCNGYRLCFGRRLMTAAWPPPRGIAAPRRS
jgi:hypothetical protein